MIQGQPVEQLVELLKWRKELVVPALTWEHVEGQLGVAVPLGVKAISSRFPAGSFGDWINFYNPVQSVQTSTMFMGTLKSVGETLRYARQVNFEEFPYNFHPEKSGLVAWGHGDQHVYFWRAPGVADPDVEVVLYCDKHGAGWGEFSGSVPEFLVELFNDRLETEILYDEWVDCQFFSEFQEFARPGN
ncbi:hypothetical protein OHS58_38685 [Amycolatopsis sp. NBC_00348]|jgi:hypothetical protein|uniref:hypothetical protein n=1 Tax=unclassified Amycolatopsis TaxID=2618356 RepID=UPI002E14A2C8|nr:MULTISPECIES: hypothetical protein [unclassified Amycolatopsis]WSJ75502.1 hypothetical protein OG439_39745 [Amycolatopsis sp. NBC_01307]